MVSIARSKILGTPEDPISGKRIDAADRDHFMKCPACGGWIDCRDLGMVLDHEAPLPHPGQDQVN
jgi:hypothetical protein